MRYSNVHESFFDFLTGLNDKEIAEIISRMEIFVSNNPEYSFDTKYALPGICSLERMAQSVVSTIPKLKKVVKRINKETDDLSIITIKGKKWMGEIIVVTNSDSVVRGNRSHSYYSKRYDYSNYNFDDYYDYYNYSKRGYRKRPYTRRRRQYESEGFITENTNPISNFFSFLKRNDMDVNDYEYNRDFVLLKLYDFLERNPAYDYNDNSETPGFIFLSLLSEYTETPYKLLYNIISSGAIEGAEIINYNYKSVEGPLVMFTEYKKERELFLSSILSKLEKDVEDQIEYEEQQGNINRPRQYANDYKTTPQKTSNEQQPTSSKKIDDFISFGNSLKNSTKEPPISIKTLKPIEIKNRIESIKEYDSPNLANQLLKSLQSSSKRKENEYLENLKRFLFIDDNTEKNIISTQTKFIENIIELLLDRDSDFFIRYGDLEKSFYDSSKSELSDDDKKSIIMKMVVYIMQENDNSIIDMLKTLYDNYKNNNINTETNQDDVESYSEPFQNKETESPKEENRNVNKLNIF